MFYYQINDMIFLERINDMQRYNKLNEYYKNKFGERTLKICIDAGFTCPNRDGTKSIGGCIFCSASGSGDLLHSKLSIKEQVTTFLNSYRGKRANKFIAYFQNFTNTYADIKTLKEKYDSALIDERIIGLDIDTRPDCINEDVCKLLQEYKKKYYVCVELGLQTVSDKNHDFINQKITNSDFIYAINLLNKYEIDVIVHVMIGLPNESHNDIINLVNFLNNINYQGIKIHSTYVLKNTILAKMYENNTYEPISFEDYFNEVIYILTHIKEDIVIHRISGDPPKESLLAPLWTTHKKWVLNGVDKYLKENNLTQGCLYKKT